MKDKTKSKREKYNVHVAEKVLEPNDQEVKKVVVHGNHEFGGVTFYNKDDIVDL